jgi:hypothetical protein
MNAVQQTGRLSLTLVLATFSLLLAACDHPRPYNEIALSLSNAGDMVIHFRPCNNDQAINVKLVEIKGDVVGDDDDVTVWEIRRTRYIALDAFTVRQTPDAYVEVVNQVPADVSQKRLGVIITKGSELRQYKSFLANQLKSERFYLDTGNYVTPQKWEQLNTCKNN